MKTGLKILLAEIFLWMAVLTIRTSLNVSLWSASDSFAANPWDVAALYDASFGGNIAMSLCVLVQFFCLKPDQPLEALLRR